MKKLFLSCLLSLFSIQSPALQIKIGKALCEEKQNAYITIASLFGSTHDNYVGIFKSVPFFNYYPSNHTLACYVAHHLHTTIEALINDRGENTYAKTYIDTIKKAFLTVDDQATKKIQNSAEAAGMIVLVEGERTLIAYCGNIRALLFSLDENNNAQDYDQISAEHVAEPIPDMVAANIQVPGMYRGFGINGLKKMSEVKGNFRADAVLRYLPLSTTKYLALVCHEVWSTLSNEEIITLLQTTLHKKPGDVHYAASMLYKAVKECKPMSTPALVVIGVDDPERDTYSPPQIEKGAPSSEPQRNLFSLLLGLSKKSLPGCYKFLRILPSYIIIL